jgi:hypothetical protein
MSRGLLAPLSPNEEVTLRRVALGLTKTRDLPRRDLDRLKRLELVETVGKQPVLTALGRQRYGMLPRPVLFAEPEAGTSTDVAGTVVDLFRRSSDRS